MSYQSSIQHTPAQGMYALQWPLSGHPQVNHTLQWSLNGHQHVCSIYSPEDIEGQLKKTSNEKMFTSLPMFVLQTSLNFKTNVIFFRRYCLCPSNDIFGMNEKNVGTMPHGKDRKYPGDKANIGNPKVNRDCSSITAIRTLTDCLEITLGP